MIIQKPYKSFHGTSVTALFFVCLLLGACHPSPVKIQGTWRLVTGTVITKGVPEVFDYTGNTRFIKIINESHFAFLKHDLNPPKDSSNHFDAGGGTYTLQGDQYTEHLDYYNDRQWESKPYTFTVSIHNDTLVQQGMEAADRENIERYVREK